MGDLSSVYGQPYPLTYFSFTFCSCVNLCNCSCCVLQVADLKTSIHLLLRHWKTYNENYERVKKMLVKLLYVVCQAKRPISSLNCLKQNLTILQVPSLVHHKYLVTLWSKESCQLTTGYRTLIFSLKGLYISSHENRAN